ncbi:MAG: aspartate/glutamate racemase family protein [Stappiaceae bacterium]
MTEPLRVMFHNPVGTDLHDHLFAEALSAQRRPGTELHVTSQRPENGAFTHIEFRAYEGRVTTGILQGVRAAQREGFDAFVIGCFYDTALQEARELSGDMIVTAPCIAACEIAASLSNRFGIIVGRRKWVGQMKSTVHEHGYSDRLSGFYDVKLGVNDFQKDHAETERRLLEAGREAIEEDYAECLILGCTLEVGFHKKLEDKLGVPVIDPSIAAFKRAEYAATLKRDCGWVPSRIWTCEAPPETEMASIGGFDVDDPFGNRIVV